MIEEHDRPWVVKIWYLGMHDEITSMEQERPTQSAATQCAECCVERYAWWTNADMGRVEMIPINRVLRVEVYQR